MTDSGESTIQAIGGTSADQLRYYVDQFADFRLGIDTYDKNFAAQFSLSMPYEMSGPRIQPILGTVNDLHDPHLQGEVIIARMKSVESEKLHVLLALGRLTAEGSDSNVTMPVTDKFDYFPTYFPARGPYGGFVVVTAGETVELHALSARGKWERLSVDETSGNKDRTPGLFLGRFLSDYGQLLPERRIRVQPTVWSLSAHTMLPPNTRKS